MYCDFNVKLFKPFTSMKTRIYPALASDWEIIPNAYNTSGGFSLKSKALNQQVADIDLRRFLEFSKKYDLTIKGLKLQGEFIVGSDRSVYTREHFDEYEAKYNSRMNEGKFIEKKDLKIGHQYLTPCGAKYVYAGAFYISNGKTIYNAKTISFSKVTKKHCYYEVAYDGERKLGIIPPKYKFTKDLGKNISEEEIEKAKFTSYHGIILASKEKATKVIFKQCDEKLSMGRGYFEDAFLFIDGEFSFVNGIEKFDEKSCYRYNGWDMQKLEINGEEFMVRKWYVHKVLDKNTEIPEIAYKTFFKPELS